MTPLTEKQIKSFELGKWMIEVYKQASEEHQDPKINMSTIVGDMIADLQYTMTRVYQYPMGDIESVRIVALDSLTFDHTV